MNARKRLERGAKPTPNLAITILPPDERKQVLKEIALHAIQKPVSAGHKIAAIRELNLMEQIYQIPPNFNDNRTYNIIIQGEDARKDFDFIMSGRKPELPQHIVEGQAKDTGKLQDVVDGELNNEE